MAEQIRPGAGGPIAQIVRGSAEARWSFFFEQREKSRKTGQQFGRIRRAGQRDLGVFRRCSLDPMVEALLETGHIDVEAEDFGRERVLIGKFFSPLDALLPRSLGHWAIMGPRIVARNCVGVERHAGERTRLTVASLWDYSFLQIGVPSRFLM